MPGFKIKKQEGYVLSTAEKETLEAITILGDPGADRILFWDASEGTWKFLTVGAGLDITGTTITSTGLVNPMTAVGDTMYGGAAGVATRLAGNTTTTKKFLTSTGDGSDATAPAWAVLETTDIPDLSGTYSTDLHANIIALNAVSGVNTGDQDLSGYATLVSPSFTTPNIGAATGISLALSGTTLGMLSLKNTDADAYTRMLFDGTGNDWSSGVGNANAAITDLRNKFYIYDFTNAKIAMTIDPSTLHAKFYGTLEAPVKLNPQTDNYTLALSDAGSAVTITHGSAKTLTIPKNSVVAFPVGTKIAIYQGGAGQVTIAPVDGDVTIKSFENAYKIAGEDAGAMLLKTGVNEWRLEGNVTDS